MEQIKVICTEGKVKIEAIGFTGATCEEATRFLESRLGQQSNKQHKPEYFEQEELPQHLTN